LLLFGGDVEALEAFKAEIEESGILDNLSVEEIMEAA